MTTGDLWAVVWAAAAALGAWAGMEVGALPHVPLWLGAGIVAVALLRRRPAIAGLAVAVLAAGLAQRSMSGLATPPPSGPVRAEVTLLRDPAPLRGGSVGADARLGRRRLSLVAHRSSAAALADRLAGERILVVGRVGPPGDYERRMPHRHLAGRLEVDAVAGWRPGHGVTRAANGLRRTLAEGAASLPDRPRSLLLGLTLGDDRAQPADLAGAFEDAGLTHLTAVSGSNVAFVLVLAGPLLVRLRFGPRLVVTLGLLGGFALVTRGEPSVLRATAMAATAAYGTAVGRPVSSLRALGLGVTGLLLVDPLLVSSVGFQLSALGTLGIVVAATPLARRLPGPRWLALPLAVTAAAQLAVAPLLIVTFGPVRVASLPANLLAVPAAGPVMVWGLTAGLVAGMAGEPVATVLHLPTRLLLAWIDGVATVAARVPLGSVGLAQWAVLTASVVLAVATRPVRDPAPPIGLVPAGDPRSALVPAGHSRSALVPAGVPPSGVMGAGGSRSQVLAARGPRRGRWGRARRGVGLAGLAVVTVTAVVPGDGHGGRTGAIELSAGATAWRAGGAAVAMVDGRAEGAAFVRDVLATGLTRLDVLVVATASPRAADVAGDARERWPRLVVLAPEEGAARIAGAIVPPSGRVVDVGGVRLRFGPTTRELRPRIELLPSTSPAPAASRGGGSGR